MATDNYARSSSCSDELTLLCKFPSPSWNSIGFDHTLRPRMATTNSSEP